MINNPHVFCYDQYNSISPEHYNMVSEGYEQLGKVIAKETVQKTNITENYCTNNISTPGFQPVPDEYPYSDKNKRLHDNFMYKKWCEGTFANGKRIYEAYREIAFEIKYTPEQAETDIWQTPYETERLKCGDCEDAVFLFASRLPSIQNNATITWGWVIDRKSRIARAHVWYQLKDKKGQEYIVEGFSNDWSGIIPIEIVERSESRKPIFVITHSEISNFIGLLPEADEWIDFGYEENKFPTFLEYSNDPEIRQSVQNETSKILKKLRVMFLRYNKQRLEIHPVSQISNTINRDTHLKTKLFVD